MAKATGYRYGSMGYRMREGKISRGDGSEVGAAPALAGNTDELRRLGYTEEDVQAILAAQQNRMDADGNITVDPSDPYPAGGIAEQMLALFGRVRGSASGTRPLQVLKGLLGRLVQGASPTAPSSGGTSGGSAGGSTSTSRSFTGSYDNEGSRYGSGAGGER